MPFPNYTNSIINLSCTLADFLGADTPAQYPSLAVLEKNLNRDKHIILLIIDGLAYDFVIQQATNSFFAKHIIAQIDSVFPSTTASAITTYMSGVSPNEHGLTGWFTHFDEIGQVAAILPYRSRGDWTDLQDKLGESSILFPNQNFFRNIDRTTCMVMPDPLINSRYSRHFSQHINQNIAFTGLDDLFNKLLSIQTNETKFAYAYWPELDATAHQFGSRSEEAVNHFQAIDQALEKFCSQLTNTQLIVCADHGFIDTEPHKVIYIDEHPELHACLIQPLCGEPRTVFCYVAPDKYSFFEDYVKTNLSNVCECMPSQKLLEQNVFGLGLPHEQISKRIGSHTLLLKENYVIVEQLENEPTFSMVGVHGGISQEEMQVPLFFYEQ